MPTSVGTNQSYTYPSGRSRSELRTLVAKVFGHWTGSATGNGSTTTLPDTRLSRFADDYFIGTEVWVKWKSASAAGYTSFVTDFVAATGTLTFAPAMGAAVASGDAYEVFRYVTKEEIDDALAEVCKGGTAWKALTPNTDDHLDYSLNNINTLFRPSQVLEVVRLRLADQTLMPARIHGWSLEDNAGLLTLRLPSAPDTTDSLWLVYEIGEQGLQHDDDKTGLPADLVRPRAVLWLLENMLVDQDEQGLAKYGQLARYWRERLKEAESAMARTPGWAVIHQWTEDSSGPDPLWSALGLVERYAT
jgi:hypothetical protein